jgi:uncharacterized membrane protein YdbT with pleckstrin-like domain
MEYSYHPYPIAAVIKSLFFVGILLALVFLARDLAGDLFLPLVALVLALGLLKISSHYLTSRLYTVTLKDESIAYQYGIIARKQYIIPYSKITEASYSQSIIQRILGTGDISIDTPGGVAMAVHLNDVRYSDIKKTLDLVHEKAK